MPITTQVTWQDLQQSLDSELDELRDAHQEIRELATEEYGEDALDRVLPADPELLKDGEEEGEEDERDLYVYQSQLEQYEQTAKLNQSNKHLLDKMQDEYGSGSFEIKMLSGQEAMDIEQELRMLANAEGVEMQTMQIKRNALIVDAATVDAPEGVPRDDDGSPVPSECPNSLTVAIYGKVEKYNNSGDMDFRPVGFEDGTGGSSGPLSTTDSHLPQSDPTENEPQ